MTSGWSDTLFIKIEKFSSPSWSCRTPILLLLLFSCLPVLLARNVLPNLVHARKHRGSRKSLLFDKGTAWMKKNSYVVFDVTMGSYDGAEVCELVVHYILSILSGKYGKSQIGLYRDDAWSSSIQQQQQQPNTRQHQERNHQSF